MRLINGVRSASEARLRNTPRASKTQANIERVARWVDPGAWELDGREAFTRRESAREEAREELGLRPSKACIEFLAGCGYDAVMMQDHNRAWAAGTHPWQQK